MRVVPGGTVLVGGLRMTVLSGRAGVYGGQDAGGKGDEILRFHNTLYESAILNLSC